MKLKKLKPKKILLLPLGGIILIIIGITLTLSVSAKICKEKEEKNIVKIEELFLSVSEKMDSFSLIRKDFVIDVLNKLKLSYIDAEYEDWIKRIDEYKVATDEIIIKKEAIEELCVLQTYKNKKANNNCNSLFINYETAMNYFVKDIKAFNEFIKSASKENIKVYDLDDIYVYADINNDGRFTGK